MRVEKGRAEHVREEALQEAGREEQKGGGQTKPTELLVLLPSFPALRWVSLLLWLTFALGRRPTRSEGQLPPSQAEGTPEERGEGTWLEGGRRVEERWRRYEEGGGVHLCNHACYHDGHQAVITSITAVINAFKTIITALTRRPSLASLSSL